MNVNGTRRYYPNNVSQHVLYNIRNGRNYLCKYTYFSYISQKSVTNIKKKETSRKYIPTIYRYIFRVIKNSRRTLHLVTFASNTIYLIYPIITFDYLLPVSLHHTMPLLVINRVSHSNFSATTIQSSFLGKLFTLRRRKSSYQWRERKSKTKKKRSERVQNKFLSLTHRLFSPEGRTQEGHSRFVPKFKERMHASTSSTPPRRNLLFFTSQPFLFHPFSQPILLTSRKEYSHTRTGPSLFPVSGKRNGTRMYDEVRRDAACRLKPSFSLLDPRYHGAEGVGCVCRSPPRRPSPTPVPAVYPYWRELGATWCAIVDRSTLAPLSKGENTFQRGIVVEDIFLRMP